MSKDTQNDELLDDAGEWLEDLSDNGIIEDHVKRGPRSGPKWKAIEDYWEQKRLRDQLQDYYSEEDVAETAAPSPLR